MRSCSGLFDFAAVDELKRPAAKRGKSLPQLALRSTLSNPMIVGSASSPADVRKNAGALGWEINKADMAEIDVIFDRHGAITLPPGWLEN
jgi:aryl-alcohol dehydrogenase-like predicted oxidoreductase